MCAYCKRNACVGLLLTIKSVSPSSYKVTSHSKTTIHYETLASYIRWYSVMSGWSFLNDYSLMLDSASGWRYRWLLTVGIPSLDYLSFWNEQRQPVKRIKKPNKKNFNQRICRFLHLKHSTTTLWFSLIHRFNDLKSNKHNYEKVIRKWNIPTWWQSRMKKLHTTDGNIAILMVASFK